MADKSPSRGNGRRPALALAALLFGSGVLHFVMPKLYDSTIPRALPGRPRDYTYVSGVAEFGIAAALAVPRTRSLGGRLAALLFVVVFPANVQMAVDMVNSSKTSRAVKIGAVLRLPLQIPLVTKSLEVSRRSRGA